jgi:hypothetical protein
MATWSDVQARVRREYTLELDQADEFAVTLERKDTDKTRKQRVMVRRYQAWGRDMLEIRSAFGEIGEYQAESLLADNLNLPLGAIALHGKFLVLVQKACLEDLSLDGVLFLLARVSLLADVLEGRKGGDRF